MNEYEYEYEYRFIYQYLALLSNTSEVTSYMEGGADRAPLLGANLAHLANLGSSRLLICAQSRKNFVHYAAVVQSVASSLAASL